jgi:hypothetical protein
MKILREFFSERGDMSMMRLIHLLCCFASIAIAIIGVNKPNPDYSGISILVGSFLAISTGGKIFQKKMELDGTKVETEADSKN